MKLLFVAFFLIFVALEFSYVRAAPENYNIEIKAGDNMKIRNFSLTGEIVNNGDTANADSTTTTTSVPLDGTTTTVAPGAVTTSTTPVVTGDEEAAGAEERK